MIDLRIELKTLSVFLLRIRDNQLHQSTIYENVFSLIYNFLNLLIFASYQHLPRFK